MSIKGCGVDIIEVGRIAKAIQQKRFRERIYTCRELEYLKQKPAQSWAARFAAKEAVMKAIGRGWLQGVTFSDVEIGANVHGQPNVHLKGGAREIAAAQGIKRFVISLSHTDELAIAYVIALGED